MIPLFFKYLFKFPFVKPHYYGFYKHLFLKYNVFKNKVALSTYDGDIQIKLKLDDFVQQQIYLLGYYDKPGILFLKKHISPGSVFVDIGANIGAYALIASKMVTRSGQVFAFEPASHVHDQLCRNINLNKFENIQVEKLALFNKKTSLDLKISSNANLGMSSIHAHDEETGDIEVIEAITGDEYFNMQNPEKIDLIKLDIEGAELFALQGLQQTILKFRPLILMELSDVILEKSNITKMNIISYMKHLQYEIQGINQMGEIVAMNAPDLNDSENFAFLPK